MNFKASSQDKNFGRLITSLREQHQDKYGNKWGIDTLERQCGMLSANILRKIERGEKAKRDIDLLNTLAKGLQLAESERKEFFLAAVQMAEPASPLSVQERNEMRTAFDRLLYIPMPALIMDAYCDILAANNLMESLYQITPETRSTYLVKPAGNNLLHIVYGFPEFKDRFGKNWSDIAFNNLIFFSACLFALPRYPIFC